MNPPVEVCNTIKMHLSAKEKGEKKIKKIIQDGKLVKRTSSTSKQKDEPEPKHIVKLSNNGIPKKHPVAVKKIP
jgi:hypothetical protein